MSLIPVRQIKRNNLTNTNKITMKENAIFSNKINDNSKLTNDKKIEKNKNIFGGIKKQLNSLKQKLQYQKISCQNENNRIKSKDQNVFSDDSIRRFSNDIKYADNLENVFDEFFNNEKNLPLLIIMFKTFKIPMK